MPSKKYKSRTLCLLIFCPIFAISLLAATPNDELKLKIDRVALFKNGLGYFNSSAILPESAVELVVNEMPVPSLGTFWVNYPESLNVKNIVGRIEEVDSNETIHSMIGLLSANKGKRVKLYFSQDNLGLVEGIIEAVQHDAPSELTSPYTMDVRRPESGRFQHDGRGSTCLIRTDNEMIAVIPSLISRIDFLGSDINTSFSLRLKKPQIRLMLNQPSRREQIQISYLAHGITWSPSYQIDLTNAEYAVFSAKAMVINEVADLNDVSLDLVTGFPNLQFADVSSPIAMNQSLADFLKALQSRRTESREQGTLTQNAAFIGDGRVEVPTPSYSTAQKGTESEDLFLYPVEKFTLARGETAYIPLFKAKLPFQHVYILTLSDLVDTEESRHQQTPEEEEIWHSGRLTNETKVPWTTGPVEFVKGTQIVGQEICNYTPQSGEATIRINKALNVQARQTEYEVERQRAVAKYYGYNYDLVKINAEVKIHNRLNKNILLEIEKELTGKVIQTVPEAKLMAEIRGLKRVNTQHTLTWKLDIPAGAEQIVAYTYEVYIRD